MITKTIRSYRYFRHRGFFTVQRLYRYSIWGIPYRTEWQDVTESRLKHGEVVETTKHFATIHTAKRWVANEINTILERAKSRGYQL